MINIEMGLGEEYAWPIVVEELGIIEPRDRRGVKALMREKVALEISYGRLQATYDALLKDLRKAAIYLEALSQTGSHALTASVKSHIVGELEKKVDDIATLKEKDLVTAERLAKRWRNHYRIKLPREEARQLLIERAPPLEVEV